MQTRMLLLLTVLSLSACAGRFVRIRDPLKFDHALKLIEQHNASITQLKAALSIKGIGILGHLFHEQADIVIQKPHFMLWSMRSFFDSPASMAASNGEFITMYDWSGQRSAAYEKIAIEQESVIDLFDFKIHPSFLNDMMLTRVPLKNSRKVMISKNNGRYEYSAELEDAWQLRAIFEEARSIVLEMSLVNKKAGLAYEISYADWDKHEAIMFPTLYQVRVQSMNTSLKFSMKVKRLELNGILLPKEKFFLRPQR